MKSRIYGKYKMVEINLKRLVFMIDIDGLSILFKRLLDQIKKRKYFLFIRYI